MRLKEKTALFLLTLTSVSLLLCGTAYADFEAKDSGIKEHIDASGRYDNWDGVTNIAQFESPSGNFCYAVDSGSDVTVYLTDENKENAGTVKLKKTHPLFGTALCDKDGNFYLVTGEENTNADDKTKETVFVSKYDSNGQHIKTIGDTGSSSLASYYDDGFYTQIPFHGGNCDAAINGDILTVNYARKMYNIHQSNSAFSVNIKDMSKVNTGEYYESHSFAQRVISVDKGFVFFSEGDCYSRSFTAYPVEISGGSVYPGTKAEIFHFWVRDGALDDSDMFAVNDNFARMGGAVSLHDGRVAFVAASARSLNEKAAADSQDAFIQIFDPFKDLTSKEAYTTSGERTGLSGPNGRDSVTDHGVKWLTSNEEGSRIDNIQVAAIDGKEIFILYDYTVNHIYQGLHCVLLDEDGNVEWPPTLVDEKATLNSCEMPVCSNGTVTWVGNSYNDSENVVYIYTLNFPIAPAIVTTAPVPVEGLEYDGNTHTLISEGAAEGGEIKYAVVKDDTGRPAESEYSTNLPVGKEAGTYYVWYRAFGDENHFNSSPVCLTVTIKGEGGDDPSGNDDPSKNDPSVKIPEGLGNSPSENKPMEYHKEERSGFEIYYCYAVPFWGKQKSDIRVFGEPGVTVVYEGNIYNATKVKVNKKTGLFQITGLYGVERSVVKLLKTATKGGLGLPYKVNPFYVRNDTGIFRKYKADGSLSTVKVLIGEKYYKAKKTEWSYDDSLQTIFFSGNLDGSYAIPQ